MKSEEFKKFPLTEAVRIPNVTRNTAVAACWLAFGHKLDPSTPVVIYHERAPGGKVRDYLQFRISRANDETAPMQIAMWWETAPKGLDDFHRNLTLLLKRGDVEPQAVTQGQWAAYACFMRMVFDEYRKQKREEDIDATLLLSRRMQATETVLTKIAGGAVQLDLWWSKAEGQMQFERWLDDLAKNPGIGHQNEIWAMRLPAYVVAAREFFNYLDLCHELIRQAKANKQELCREAKDGKVLEVSPYADPYRVRDLKRQGGM